MKTSEPPVIVEETFNALPDAVWKAITDVDDMRRWYFDNIPDFQARVGFATQFTVINEGREFPHQWKVTEAVPLKSITYEWRFGGYPGAGLVTFELFGRDGGTALKLTNTVLEDFPEDIPEFRRESCLAGWRYFIGESLKAYLEG